VGSSEVDTSLSYTDVFKKVFPLYLSYGMTYEQFWEGDPSLAADYREAHKIMQKRQNLNAWLQGYYVYNAIGAFAEILPAFPKKGAKVQPYMEEPIAMTDEEVKERAERKQREKMERIKQKMMGWVKK
jgi:hypothetical protein